MGWRRADIPIEAIERTAQGIGVAILCGHCYIPRAVNQDGRMVVNPEAWLPWLAGQRPHRMMETGTPDACYAILELHGTLAGDVPARAIRPNDGGAGAPEPAAGMASALATGWVR